MRRGKNFTLFPENSIQHTGLQKLKTDSDESEVGEDVYRHGQGEGTKNGSDGFFNAIIVFRFDDNRSRDIDNSVTTVLDCLVRAGILKDDSIEYLSGILVTSVKVPKGQAGVEIITFETVGEK